LAYLYLIECTNMSQKEKNAQVEAIKSDLVAGTGDSRWRLTVSQELEEYGAKFLSLKFEQDWPFTSRHAPIFDG